jgi:hypothetical protein
VIANQNETSRRSPYRASEDDALHNSPGNRSRNSVILQLQM